MTTDVTEKKRSIHDLNNEELVKLYIALRDRRSTRKRAYEMEDESDKGKQEKIGYPAPPLPGRWYGVCTHRPRHRVQGNENVL